MEAPSPARKNGLHAVRTALGAEVVESHDAMTPRELTVALFEWRSDPRDFRQ
jgi:hypothetical protein